MKPAIIAINPIINDWNGQLSIIRKAISEAKNRSADLLVFPELAISGPDAKDIFLRKDTAVMAEQVLSQIAPLTKDITLIIGTPIEHNGKLYNVAAIFNDGLLIALVPKRYPKHYTQEDKWFERWDFAITEPHYGATIGHFHSTIPGLENLEIIVGNIKNHPVPARGALCVQLYNRTFCLGEYREQLDNALEYSFTHNIMFVRANILGSDDGTHIYDGGSYIVENGHIVSLSQRFSFNQEFVITCTSDEIPKEFDPSLAQFKSSGSCPLCEDDYDYAELELALCLGLNDYLKKSHISKLCLALSGGRDSAMIAVLAGRLIALTNPDKSSDELKNIMKDFLITAYLPSQFSSSTGTQNAALALAEHFGFNCPIIPIGDIAAQTITTIEASINRKLTWETDDLTLQNVQARTRSSIIWTLANANDAMLLTTGNMSEAAVGYATMDGDTSGCLDPIGNIPKTLVSRWLQWARNFHNIPALDLVFAQPPSAELRPLEQNQADETDLMPYRILDAYMDGFINLKMSPKVCLRYMKQNCGDYYKSDEDIKNDIMKFLKMATRAQWKRVRFANSFIVSKYDLAPDSGLSWPCLQDPFSQICKNL